MKILFFINGLSAGGKERRLVELMKGLNTNPSVHFELVVMSRDIHYKEVFNLNTQIHFLIRNSRRDISIFKRLYVLCKRIRPDILHCWDSMTALYAAPVCKLLKIKLVNGSVIETPVQQNIFNKYWLRARLAFPFSNVIIGNSEAGLRAYRAPRKKSKCFYNGFNFQRIENINQSVTKESLKINTSYLVIMVGAFSNRKDYSCYISAATKLCTIRNDVTFIALGDGETFNSVLSKIPEAFKDRIRLLGKQSNVESFIAISDICVLATNSKVHGEGISNSILEYMALAKPVVATEGGGTNEIVVDGKTGFLVKASDAQDLSDKINVLLDNDSLRFSMGHAGKERILQHFSINEMVGKYFSLYVELCKH
ncbi:MAG: glycosyltransferase [Bacteroidetes bacterium]|nr:glycosyltransferase [Bacteroidota bacterium]MBS1634224.1 glycosyltransferase [Bacteroidota bacterium]